MMATELVQTKAGEPRVIRSRYGVERIVKIGRQWDVVRDGVAIGAVRYDMIRRERRTRRSGVVDARWHSPGWEYQVLPSRYWHEGYSKSDCVKRIERLTDAR